MPRSNGRRNANSWRLLRVHALNHFGWRCQDCGREGVALEVHHVDGDRRNNKLSNLAPYCKRDHIRLHGKVPPEDKQPDWGGFLNDFMADLTPAANCTKAK